MAWRRKDLDSYKRGKLVKGISCLILGSSIAIFDRLSSMTFVYLILAYVGFHESRKARRMQGFD